eukprot:SAG31_NODE_2872_length_4972_cov_55.151447_4_plen_209_part_00
MMTAAITSDEADELFCWNGGFPFAVPGGSGARAGPPSDTGHDNSLYMLQADFLDTTNLTDGAAAAAATAAGGSSGSPPNSDLYSDLQRGSGGENKIGTPPFVRALGCAPAQSFPNRCNSALRAGGGCSGGGGSFSCSCSPPMIAASTCDCEYTVRLMTLPFHAQRQQNQELWGQSLSHPYRADRLGRRHRQRHEGDRLAEGRFQSQRL